MIFCTSTLTITSTNRTRLCACATFNRTSPFPQFPPDNGRATRPTRRPTPAPAAPAAVPTRVHLPHLHHPPPSLTAPTTPSATDNTSIPEVLVIYLPTLPPYAITSSRLHILPPHASHLHVSRLHILTSSRLHASRLHPFVLQSRLSHLRALSHTASLYRQNDDVVLW